MTDVRARRAVAAAIYLLACLFGIYARYQPTITSGFARMQTDRVDARDNHFVLEHTFRWITDRQYIGTLWSPPIFYPARGVLAYSENLLGTAPIYLAVRLFNSPPHAFQLWMIACDLLCFISFVIVARRLGVSVVLAAVGAFWFAFGRSRTLELGHADLLPLFVFPLAIYVAWKFLIDPRPARLWGLAAAIYAQCLCVLHLGWFLIFSLVLFFGINLCTDASARRRIATFLRQHCGFTIAVAVVWAGLTALLAKPYLDVRHDVGTRSFSEVVTYLPVLRSWLPLPQGGPALWRNAMDALSAPLPPNGENMDFSRGFVFLGATVLTLVILLIRRRALPAERLRLAASSIGVAAILLVLSLRLADGATLWQYVYRSVPAAGSIRAVGRMHAVVYFYASLAIILVVDSLLRDRSTTLARLGQGAVAVLAILSCLEQRVHNLPSFDIATETRKEANLAYLLRHGDIGYVADYGPVDGFAHVERQVDGMWAALAANRPVVNGYNSFWPRNYNASLYSFSPQELLTWLEPIAHGQSVVVVVPNNAASESIWGRTRAKLADVTPEYLAYTFQLPGGERR